MQTIKQSVSDLISVMYLKPAWGKEPLPHTTWYKTTNDCMVDNYYSPHNYTSLEFELIENILEYDSLFDIYSVTEFKLQHTNRLSYHEIDQNDYDYDLGLILINNTNGYNSINQSNREYFKEKYSDCVGLFTIGDCETIAFCLAYMDIDQLKSLLDDLKSLWEYHILDDNRYYDIEAEKTLSLYKDEMRDEIRKKVLKVLQRDLDGSWDFHPSNNDEDFEFLTDIKGIKFADDIEDLQIVEITEDLEEYRYMIEEFNIAAICWQWFEKDDNDHKYYSYLADKVSLQFDEDRQGYMYCENFDELLDDISLQTLKTCIDENTTNTQEIGA